MHMIAGDRMVAISGGGGLLESKFAVSAESVAAATEHTASGRVLCSVHNAPLESPILGNVIISMGKLSGSKVVKQQPEPKQ